MTVPDDSADKLDKAWSTWRDVAVPPGPPREVVSQTAKRLRSVAMHESKFPNNKRGILMFRITRYGGAAAACLLVGTALWVLFFGQSAGLAFADVQAQVQKVRSIQYLETVTDEGEPPRMRRHFILGRYLERVEDSDSDGHVSHVHISDMRNGKYVSLNPKAKKFTDLTTQVTVNIDFSEREEERVKANLEVDLYRRISQLPADPVKRLPEKRLDGRNVVGFYYEEKQNRGTWKRTYWVDTETKLPVRVEIAFRGAGERFGSSEYLLTDFVFDAELDQSLFSTNPPAGYTVEEGGFVSIRAE